MFSGDIPPSIALAAYIRTYRIVDFQFAAGEVIPFKAYSPKPQHTLNFIPKDLERIQFQDSKIMHPGVRTSLMGQQTLTCNRYLTRDIMNFQVVFQPGVLHRLTGIPAYELNNNILDAECVFGKEVSLVNEQLFHATGYSHMVWIVENYLTRLIGKLKKDIHPVDKIGMLMLNNAQMHSMDYFCREACLSPRQFERKFKQHMGVSPKLYARIIRFDQAFRMRNRYPELDWLSIAIYCGYHDYQHLVKDYKDFTGYTPNGFYALEQLAPERFFGDVDT